MATSKDKTCPKSTRGLSTKELARSLGLIRKLSSSSSKTSKTKKQPFHYLVVIDYESTCWRDKRMSYAPEIIEFPAVLLNTSTGVIESEFHHYVQPNEHQRLSEFCKELTGITQPQVDAGIPIGTCLMLFSSWLQELKDKKIISFLCDVFKTSDKEQRSKEESKQCTFVTWSDWDIGICLKKECERKRHLVPPSLRAWIDLRAAYKTFYSRKPKGLAGALKDLGIQFAGRQHSGLDDARNTAKLAWRMIQDGCVMNVTSSIDVSVSILHQIIKNGFKRIETINQNQTTPKANDKQSATTDPQSPSIALVHHDVSKSGSNVKNRAANRAATSIQQCLLSPSVSVANCSPCGIQGSDNTTTLVAPITSLSNAAAHGSAKHLFKEGKKPLDMSVLKHVSINQSCPMTAKCGLSKQTLGMMSFSSSVAAFSPYSTGSPAAQNSSVIDSHASNLKRHCKGSNISSDVKDFKIPRLVDCENLLSTRSIDVVANFQQGNETGSNQKLPLNQQKYNKESFNTNLQHYNININSAVTPKPVHSLISTHKIHANKAVTPCPTKGKEKTVMPYTTNSSVTPFGSVTAYSTKGKENNVTPCTTKGRVTPFGSVTPYSTKGRVTPFGSVTPYSTKGSVTPFGSVMPYSTNVGVMPLRYNGGSVTPPLCDCGRRSRRLTVAKAGPNQGRVFYTCPVKNIRSSFGKSPVKISKTKTGCKFFCWEP